MKHGLIFLIFNFIFCVALAQTDQERIGAAQKKDQSAFNKLDSVYNVLLKKYRRNGNFIQLFKKAQNAWKNFLEAEMAARFPEQPVENSNKLQPMCFYLYRTLLLNERTNQLELLLGDPKNNSCDGIIQVQ